MKIIRNTDFVAESLLSESEELDRISNLPDEILEIILSFIDDSNLIVQTSVLSQRWKDLWVSMRMFDFDFTEYTGFSAKSPKIFNFPDRLLNSKTLRELSIKYPMHGGIRLPRPFVLPNLKVLYLQHFRFDYDSDDDDDDYDQCNIFPKEPFSGFSKLEKLTLYDCFWVDDLIISTSKLKVLELSYLNRGHRATTRMKEIYAPELTSLRYQCSYALACEKLVCPRLEELYLCMHAIYSGGQSGRDAAYKKIAPELIKMLQQFGNYVKSVTFATKTIEILAADPRLLKCSRSPFPYLKDVKYFILDSYRRHIKYSMPQLVIDYLQPEGSSYDVSFSLDYSTCDFWTKY